MRGNIEASSVPMKIERGSAKNGSRAEAVLWGHFVKQGKLVLCD